MLTVKELAARVPDGASVALAPDYSGCALAAVRALIRRGARDLHLIGVPQLGSLFTDGFYRDFLDPIVAGLVASVLLALLFDLVIIGVAWALTPWTRTGGTSRRRAAA